MGLGRGLVKRVFCKSKSSIGTLNASNFKLDIIYDMGSELDKCMNSPTPLSPNQERNLGVDKSRWTSVRLYLCGDELNSVLVENDSASIRSSDVTVMQPLQDDSGDGGGCEVAKLEEFEEFITKGEEDVTTKLSEDEAATFIQSAFRGFMARQRYEDIKRTSKGDDITVDDPSGVNEAASTEVLVDDSIENFSVWQENTAIQHRVLHKSQSQVYRLKEEWDDSTLSSDTLRLRIQNRLEATTRRERALAYAFAQQLRTCTTKKKPTWADSNTEANTGWTWLERWMATRAPENSVAEDCWSKHLEPISSDRRLPVFANKRFDISIEGKESCGSNDVSVNFEGGILPSQTPGDGYAHVKNIFKATRTVSRRKTMPEYLRPQGSTKTNKKVSSKESEEKRLKQVQARSTGETKSKDALQA